MSNSNTNIALLTLITTRNKKDLILSELLNFGAQLVNTLYGKGSANAGVLLSSLGLVHEENKAVIICLISKDNLDGAMNMLVEKFKFNLPNTGIAFSVSLSDLSF